MDPHLKVLFGRFHDQFGAGPGLGPPSAACLHPSAPPPLVAALYRACAALHRSNPWRRLRPSHLLALRVGKDADWPPSHRQPFPCAHLLGASAGDLSLLLFRSHSDAARASANPTPRLPNLEVLRVTFAPFPHLSPANRRMIRALSLEPASLDGESVYPVIDVARCGPAGGDLRFRNPNTDELRFLFAVVKALALVHPLLRETKERSAKWARSVEFEPFIETLDVQWPPEFAKGGRDTVAVTISHPPDHVYDHKTSPSRSPSSPSPAISMSMSPAASPTKRADTNGTWAVARKCEMCEKETNGEQCLCCGRCRAVVYCSAVCQKQHWKETHKAVCGLYKAMMDREEELAMKVFVFPCLVEHPCRWLELVGLHQRGMWRRKCACYSHSPFGLLPVKNGAAESWGGLGDGEYPPDYPFPNEDGGIHSPILLSSWPEYYNLRSLPLSSPVAAILSHPLTVYHILTSLSTGSKTSLHRGREVVVHYPGPECELDWLLAFAEIGHLLNGSGNLLIVMVGPEVPSNLSGTVLGIGSRVRVNLVRGVYQEEVTYLPSPHVIVALNSGLDSGLSWAGALEMIKASNVPAFFTDQSELVCANAKQVLKTAGLHISLPVTPNPFRSPVRNNDPSNNLPSYSNGFVFGVNT